MTEDFLIYIWRYQLYTPDLQTSEGQKVIVKNPGIRNTNAGPDFNNAMVRIGATLWAGNIEVHKKSSDWYLHLHQNDDAYSNVILHVVFEYDSIVLDRNGNPIPTIELKGKIDEDRFSKYQYFLSNKNWIPCSREISLVNPITLSSWLERMSVERIERKTDAIEKVFLHNKNNWEESFYQVLAGNFGFKVNEQPFRMLATMLPLQILNKHRNNRMQLEALLMGQAGLLKQEFTDEYPIQLKNEYNFLKQKYSLIPMETHLWKFMRLRPANFPTIRISQFADLISKHANLFSVILECSTIDGLFSVFNAYTSEYWKNHFSFDTVSTSFQKKLGAVAIRIIIINTVVQFVYYYGTVRDKQRYCDKAIQFLLDLPPEKNAIVREWEKLSIKAENALESQALLELKNKYCDLKKCLHCSLGLKLLNMSK